jgi:ATP-dependent helicase/DNAse subunit B
MDRGNLIHRILFRLFSDLRREKRLPLKPADREYAEHHLTEVAGEILDDAELRLPVGYAPLWKMEKAYLLSDLKALLTEEFREEMFVPADFEIRFGMPARSSDEGEWSTDRPLRIKLGRSEISLCGQIDRLDLSRDGKRARIVDYKSGTLKVGDDAMDGGQAMQLPVYLSALPLLAPEVSLETSEAILLSTTYGSGFERARFSGEILAGRAKEFHQILSTFLRNLQTGTFPLHPGDQRSNCKVCDFTAICGKGVGRIYERKADDPATANLLALEEIS